MDVNVVLSSDEILRGLKHYRRLAKQDLLRADDAEHPDAFRRHAEARREVYAELTEIATHGTPEEVAHTALTIYKELPFVTGSPADAHAAVKGRENALENFFLMIGLEPKVRREMRSQRPSANP
ncbi:MAG: hypothetical protein ACOCUN_03390 [Jiangellaceae bacterium]